MRAVTVSDAKARLNEIVEAAETTHEQILITRHGKPAVVMIAADDLESMQETIHWLSQPGIKETIAEADADFATGCGVDSDTLRAELGLPSA